MDICSNNVHDQKKKSVFSNKIYTVSVIVVSGKHLLILLL